MKKKSLRFSGIITAMSIAAQLTVMPVCDAASNNYYLANYGTESQPVLGPDGLMSIFATDNSGSENSVIDDITFILYDEDNKKIASWTGNDSESVTLLASAEKNNYRFYKQDSYMTVSLETFQGLNKTDEELKQVLLKSSNYTSLLTKNSLNHLEFGTDYSVTLETFDEDEEPDLIVPAHTFVLNVDDAYKDRESVFGFRIVDPSKESNNTITEFEYNDSPGLMLSRQMPDGGYGYYLFGHEKDSGNSDSGGNVNNRIYIDDQPHKYVKRTINLYDITDPFNKSTIEDFRSKKNSDAPSRPGAITVIIGPLVNAPVPDKDGNITIFTEKKDNRINLQKCYLGGGGTTSGFGYAYKCRNSSLKTIDLPKGSINIQTLKEKKYTVKAENVPEKYEIITNGPICPKLYPDGTTGAKICSYEIEVRKKRFSLTVPEVKHGKLSIQPGTYDQIPADQSYDLKPIPDNYYELSGYNVYNENGEIIPDDKFKISEDNTFEMPCENITIEPVFKRNAILKGDINGDGMISIIDLVMLKNYLCLAGDLDDEAKEAADMNSDGNINMFDNIRLLNILLSHDD